MSKLEDLELKYVDNLGRVKMIKWGNDYHKWPWEKRLEYAEVLASAMNQAAELFQKERDQLLEEVLRLKELNENADKAVGISKGIVIKHITESNEKHQKYLEEISELKNRIYEQDKLLKTYL